MPRRPPQLTSTAKSSSNDFRRVIDSAKRHELVVVIGTGVSLALTDGKVPALSWKGLIADCFAFALKKGKITGAQFKGWKPQRESNDVDDLLGAAEFVGRRLGAPQGELYSRWLKDVFGSVQPTNKEMIRAVEALRAAGVRLCTLNYDSLLESVTGLPTLTLADQGAAIAWMRNERPAILHLHGSWENPSSCILGIRDYEATLNDEVRDLIQRSLGTFKRLLFVGCGGTFEDPNLSALVRWLRTKLKTAAPSHYALVPDGQVGDRHKDPAWEGFVDPIGFGSNQKYLSKFLIMHFEALSTGNAPKKRAAGAVRSAGNANSSLLQSYRAFLLKDNGQMSIDGVGADMETAKQRFDLERLFVPLKVKRVPPEFPASDPMSERKLEEWQRKHSTPVPFGEAFEKSKGLALLALPGGGKTLLLKRLAVAYADPARLTVSGDGLPELDVTPVVIRCREWRDYIHLPVHTILGSLPDITGQPGLSGLREALLPLFKSGRALLLVDGLDEIHEDARRSTFVENLEKFIGDHPKTRLVVTSREAGFSLVAPNLARFCERWRVAPLDPPAISALCCHWHLLMVGDSPEARAEGEQVSRLIQGKDSLRRLGEIPLLLTMLLVVKQGAGRLPPDRVSLYRKAVDVLLDTWNIKGHEPLNPKEAAPQLAFVAYEMLRAGKQTATGEEFLKLIEESRDKVPQIRRYAKDQPHEFFKRVELRSSLVLEEGRQAALSGTVPIYQFRHLTFQEYLAAVAAVEGHYGGYDKGDTLLTPLESYCPGT